ncbi:MULTISPECIES: DUF4352 domain-containing protein [unclassified Nocardiopsis]|uniref:DUF4352 domain-containing protein n=1 Tax=unclassified Nocardiopsis TaxID=2649073 RepID=UPI00135C2C6F|nr:MULTISPECIES: DUF4352 domain-containing protein [unclassified Nocardiopsis]
MSNPQYPSGPQQPPYGGQPPYGDPTGGQPSYGDPTGGQSPYGAPPGGQPPYGDPTGGQPPYGNPPGGQPPYGMPPGPPGGEFPYGPPPGGQPPKQGMSTGAKVGIGVGAGCLGIIVILVIVIVFAIFASGGEDTPSSAPNPSVTQEEEPAEDTAPAEEEPAADGRGVSITATPAGTAGDVIDDTVYTVLDVEIVNNGDQDLDINPLYFSTVLDDGTERSDWAEALFADIEPFEVGTLPPGSSVSGQIAVEGEVTIVEVRYDPTFGMEEPITTTVQ